MLLGIDLGNTRIKIGLFETKKRTLQGILNIKTKKQVFTKEKIKVMEWIKSFKFSNQDFSNKNIEGIICCNVVPSLEEDLIEFSQKITNYGVTFVTKELETGLSYDYQGELGADRIANASGAKELYGKKDMIVIDFGTATTFCVINEEGRYLGGLIMPGLGIGLESLINKTEKLMGVNLERRPTQILGKNTYEGIQSGIYHGLIGSIEWIVKKLSKECKFREKKVIATGGYAKIVSQGTQAIDIVDMDLTMKGLEIIYQKSQKF